MLDGHGLLEPRPPQIVLKLAGQNLKGGRRQGEGGGEEGGMGAVRELPPATRNLWGQQPSSSRPARRAGTAWRCTGVGSWNPDALRLCWSLPDRTLPASSSSKLCAIAIKSDMNRSGQRIQTQVFFHTLRSLLKICTPTHVGLFFLAQCFPLFMS